MKQRAHRHLPVWKASIKLVEAFCMVGTQSHIWLNDVKSQLLTVISSLKRRSRKVIPSSIT